jgi:hypothetical protein
MLPTITGARRQFGSYVFPRRPSQYQPAMSGWNEIVKPYIVREV